MIYDWLRNPPVVGQCLALMRPRSVGTPGPSRVSRRGSPPASRHHQCPHRPADFGSLTPHAIDVGPLKTEPPQKTPWHKGKSPGAGEKVNCRARSIRIRLKREAEWDPNVAAVNQNVCKGVKWPCAWWTDPSVCAPTERGDDLRCRFPCPTERQFVDPSIHRPTTESRPHERRRAVHDHADQVGNNRLDVPAGAEARLSQFFLIQFSSQVSDLATFVCSRSEDPLTIHGQRLAQRRLSKATFLAWYLFRCQESRRRQSNGPWPPSDSVRA